MRGSTLGARKLGLDHWPVAAGPRILVPGWPQWRWRQNERALALFGSFGAAVAVGLFAWGTLPGWVFLAFAVATHVVSTADAIRQRAFPGFERAVPWVSAAAGLGMVYLPALVLLGNLACPIQAGRGGFLINRWAYAEAPMEAGHWVSYRGTAGTPTARGGIGRLHARAGEEVEWIDGHLRVGGEVREWFPTGVVTPTVHGFLMKLPEGHVLIEPLDPAAGPWLVVPEQAIEGRAWAQH
jgi:hypothetical protein